jgi:hypothetical protein
MAEQLFIPVTTSFSLDAGSYTVEVLEEKTFYRIVPPAKTMMEQVIEFLEQLPVPRDKGIQRRYLGVGFAALTMRWGSYLAALCSPTFSQYEPDPKVLARLGNSEVSVINNEEMRRLNIEISANIAHLGTMYRESPTFFYDLLLRACAHLPMPIRTAGRSHNLNRLIDRAHIAGSLKLYGATQSEEAKKLFKAFNLENKFNKLAAFVPKALPGEPNRIIGNYLAIYGWRNTLIEEFHGGLNLNVDHPLKPAQRRLSNKDEKILMKELCNNSFELVEAVTTLYSSKRFYNDPIYDFVQLYPESAVALYNTDAIMAYYPEGWSTCEHSAEVVLSHINN